MGLFSRLADWIAGRRELEWTVVTPKKPGWYWVEMDSGKLTIVKLVRLHGRMVCMDSGAVLVDLGDIRFWAGPISLPASRPGAGKAA